MYAYLRSPGEIIFGAGTRSAIPRVTALRGSRAFVVIDPFLAGTSTVADLHTHLETAGVATRIYSDVVPELPTDSVRRAADAARSFNADVLIAIGGGSSIDTAKLTAVLLAHGGDVSDYTGEGRVPGRIAPIIAVPTTAGTGSEVTPVAVVTDPILGSKVGVSSPYLIPDVAICDPSLTLTSPSGVTSASGADALCHAIEAYTATKSPHDAALSQRVFMGSTALTDSLALEAIRRIATGLVRAYRDPEDADARASTLYGSMLAGLAFGTAGTAAAHALQYPIGAETHTPHGIGVGLLLPYVMQVNRPARVGEFAAVARALGAPDGDADDLAREAPQRVQQLMRDIDIPTTLSAIGFPEDRLDWAAENGIRAKRLAENNPVPLTLSTARRILGAAFDGGLDSLTELRATGVTS